VSGGSADTTVEPPGAVRNLDPGATGTINVRARNAQGLGAEQTVRITISPAQR
jgi:hypothetical protein